MNIIFVVDSFVLGGAERQAYMLANYLNQNKNYNITFLAINNNDGDEILKNNLIENKIKFEYIKFGFYSNFIWKIFNLILFSYRLRKYSPKIIIPFTIRPNIACSAIWQLTGAKICIWNQQDLGIGFTKKYKDKILWWSLKNTPLFVSNSIGGKIALENYYPKHSKIKVIYNGATFNSKETSKSYWLRYLNLKNSDFLVLKVANITKNKDHITLIKSWNELRSNTYEDFKMPILIFAGYHGDTYNEVVKLIREYKLEKYILTPGSIGDIVGLISIVDLSIFSSVSEGLPNGIIECMAGKLPVISTHISGAIEALGEDYKYYVDVGDFKGFTKHVIFLMNNKNIRLEVGERNFMRIKSVFDYKKMYLAYEDLIKKYI